MCRKNSRDNEILNRKQLDHFYVKSTYHPFPVVGYRIYYTPLMRISVDHSSWLNHLE